MSKIILSPSQNINKSESNKFDVFNLKFGANTFTFVNKLLLIFWYGGSINFVLVRKKILIE
jgi:hypothetical protein